MYLETLHIIMVEVSYNIVSPGEVEYDVWNMMSSAKQKNSNDWARVNLINLKSTLK